MVPTVPLPRRPLDTDDTPGGLTSDAGSDVTGDIRRWYENELGWATVPGSGSSGFPPRLAVGRCFDVLDVPAEAGFATLRQRARTRAPGSPVALCGDGDRMLLLVAAGSADELPGLLDWLEWGGLTPDLRAIGAGGHIEAPLPPGFPGLPALSGFSGGTGDLPGLTNPQGAAVWLRPPETGCGTEIPLPTMSALGGVGGAPDLVRLVDTLATQCHRVRLRRASAQPLAFS
ncbi:SCO3374 family protein [Streptomyces sp. NBC_00280]|uniref:SCO3374 family protein n=1 Tax=Streptomyces sp. NBC_00280 TaxID=2975699 RepID=UPI00324CFE0D